MADLSNIDFIGDGSWYDVPSPLGASLGNRFDYAGFAYFIYVTTPPPPAPPQPQSTTLQFLGSLPSDVDFGGDVLAFPSLDETFTLVNDGRVVAEAVARRLSTPRGTLPFHPDYGLDLRQYLSESVTQDTLYQAKAAIELECEQDERVQTATVQVTYISSTHQLRVAIEVVTSSGPFRFLLSVSQVSVDLLAEE